MNMAELSTLPLAQRIEAMEVLWQSLSSNNAFEAGPTWHAELLTQRMAEIESGHASAWPEAKTRIFSLAEQLKSKLHA